MPEIKWTEFSEVDPKREYYAVIGMGERKSVWSFFRFLMRARAIQGQLKTAKGLVGFTARLEFLGKKVVNLAVFENEPAATEFVHYGQHAKCMEVTKPHLKEGMKYSRWRIAGSEVPPKLDDAINRIVTLKEVKKK